MVTEFILNGGVSSVKKYLEYKEIADWLYIQRVSVQLKIHKADSSDCARVIIPMFNFHVDTFANKLDFFEDSKSYQFRELLWKTQKYEKFAKFLEEFNKKTFYDKSCYNFPGFYYIVS